MPLLLVRSAPTARLAAWARGASERPRILLAPAGAIPRNADWFEDRIEIPSGPITPEAWRAVLPAIRRAAPSAALVPMTDGGHTYREVLSAVLATGVEEIRTEDFSHIREVYGARELAAALETGTGTALCAEPVPGVRAEIPADAEVLYLANEGSEAPLIETRVFRYLEPLARSGRRIALLTPESTRWDGRLARAEAVAAKRAGLPRNLAWSPLPIRGDVEATLAAALDGAARLPPLLHARAFGPMRVAAEAARARGVRWIADPRGIWPEEAVRLGLVSGPAIAALEREFVEILSSADVVVAHGTGLARALAARIPRARIRTLRNAADTTRFDPAEREAARRRLGCGEALVLAHLGGTGNYQDFARAFDILRAIPEAQLLFLSYQNPEMVLDRVLDELGDRIDARRLTPEEVGRDLAAADWGLVLRPPGEDMAACFPTKTCEFLAAGVPLLYSPHVEDLAVVAADVGLPVPPEGPIPADLPARARAADPAARTACRVRAEALWASDGPEALGRIWDEALA